MDLICDTCGNIGIWIPKSMVEDEIKRHVEGDTSTPKRAKQYPPHPGHVVTAVPDATRPVI